MSIKVPEIKLKSMRASENVGIIARGLGVSSELPPNELAIQLKAAIDALPLSSRKMAIIADLGWEGCMSSNINEFHKTRWW